MRLICKLLFSCAMWLSSLRIWLQNGPACKQCGAYNGHSPDCPNRTFKEKAQSNKDYHQFWMISQEQAALRWQRVKAQVDLLQGKLAVLRRENNRLRAQLRRGP